MKLIVEEKPLFWMGSSKRDLIDCPVEVRKQFGFALGLAQLGQKHHKAKPLAGYRGAGVLEAIADFDGSTFRAVYTVRFPEAVYSLHVFQKKSKSGIATPRCDLELIGKRLFQAQLHYLKWVATRK